MAVEVTTRQKSTKMLVDLQEADPDVARIVTYTALVVVFMKDDATGKWTEAGIEGGMYIVHRETAPFYKLLVKNRKEGGAGNIEDDLDEDWEVDASPLHLCYATGDPTKNVRCLWFQMDSERKKCQVQFEIIMHKIKEGKAGPCTATESFIKAKSKEDKEKEGMTNEALFATWGKKQDEKAADEVQLDDTITYKVNKGVLQGGLSTCAGDPTFLEAMFFTLKDMERTIGQAAPSKAANIGANVKADPRSGAAKDAAAALEAGVGKISAAEAAAIRDKHGTSS